MTSRDYSFYFHSKLALRPRLRHLNSLFRLCFNNKRMMPIANYTFILFLLLR